MERSIDDEIDGILEQTDELFWSGEFEKVDELLADAESEDCIDIRLGWLAATLVAKPNLKNRQSYFEDTKALLKDDPRCDALLGGLE